MIRKLGKYDVVRVLGHGATSTVYLGRDPFAQRDVAIKVASPEALLDPERGHLYSRLFLNEASLVGKLEHPHIAQIYDAVVAEKLCYTVMEYVPGGTLDDYTRPDHLLPVERAIEYVFKCTRALDYAFRLGLAHRDIKPANILLANDADIKISDFGAAISSVGVQRTQISGIGSPAYMSPEQVQEQPLDHRTDIWSLGVVLYQLLTGRLPFTADTGFKMVYQIIHAEPPPPTSLRPELPPALDAIVARAMAKDLEDRYQTWEQFAHDLAQVARNRPVKARSATLDDTEKFDILRAMPFFAHFPDGELWEVLRFSHWHRVKRESVVMRDGDTGNFFCFLADGELKVTKGGRLLNLLTPGECFGEMAVVSRSGHVRGADVVALAPSSLITIRRDALDKASESCRMHFYQSFLEVLASRLTLANQRLAAF